MDNLFDHTLQQIKADVWGILLRPVTKAETMPSVVTDAHDTYPDVTLALTKVERAQAGSTNSLVGVGSVDGTRPPPLRPRQAKEM